MRGGHRCQCSPRWNAPRGLAHLRRVAEGLEEAEEEAPRTGTDPGREGGHALGGRERGDQVEHRRRRARGKARRLGARNDPVHASPVDGLEDGERDAAFEVRRRLGARAGRRRAGRARRGRKAPRALPGWRAARRRPRSRRQDAPRRAPARRRRRRGRWPRASLGGRATARLDHTRADPSRMPKRGLFVNAMVTSGAPPHPALSPSGGEGTARGPLSLGRERAGVRVRRQFANYSG